MRLYGGLFVIKIRSLCGWEILHLAGNTEYLNILSRLFFYAFFKIQV